MDWPSLKHNSFSGCASRDSNVSGRCVCVSSSSLLFFPFSSISLHLFSLPLFLYDWNGRCGGPRAFFLSPFNDIIVCDRHHRSAQKLERAVLEEEARQLCGREANCIGITAARSAHQNLPWTRHALAVLPASPSKRRGPAGVFFLLCARDAKSGWNWRACTTVLPPNFPQDFLQYRSGACLE